MFFVPFTLKKKTKKTKNQKPKKTKNKKNTTHTSRRYLAHILNTTCGILQKRFYYFQHS